MIRIAPGLYVFGVAALAACGTSKDSDSVGTSTGYTGTQPVTGYTSTSVGTTFSVAVDWNDDDGQVPTDSDGDGILDSGCGDSVDITIHDPLGVTDWSFGMVEAGPDGWTGEDCLTGFGTYAFCHQIGIDHTLAEVADCAAGSVVESSSTLLDASKEPSLTYFLEDGSGYCFVWGNDPSYYAAMSCVELFQ